MPDLPSDVIITDLGTRHSYCYLYYETMALAFICKMM